MESRSRLSVGLLQPPDPILIEDSDLTPSSINPNYPHSYLLNIVMLLVSTIGVLVFATREYLCTKLPTLSASFSIREVAFDSEVAELAPAALLPPTGSPRSYILPGLSRATACHPPHAYAYTIGQLVQRFKFPVSNSPTPPGNFKTFSNSPRRT